MSDHPHDHTGEGGDVAPLLRMVDIHKAFPGVQALEGVHFDVRPGEVHGLLGENGSGKSTLVKIAGGEQQPDRGYLLIGDDEVHFRRPADAIRAGIGAIAQEIPLVRTLTVTENVLLGRLPHRGPVVDWPRANELAARALAELGADIPVSARAGDLPLDQQQTVSIARALSSEARVLIFDEATSSLTDDQVAALLETIRGLRERGVGLVFISHRLKEVRAIADRVTVLRDGHHVATVDAGEADEDDLVAMMVGRALVDHFHKREVQTGEVLLETDGIAWTDEPQSIDVRVRAGEIVGLAGLVGSGRSELLRVLFGLLPLRQGVIRIDGRQVSIERPADAIALGVALVPEDRKRAGLVLNSSVRHNLNMARTARIFPRLLVRAKTERAIAARFAERLQIKTRNLDSEVRLLSGGNQQKVVLGKWLATEPAIWLLDEPTRGVDVGAKAEIYRIMGELAGAGRAVLMAASELPDLLGVCDRIIVMYRGRVVGELPRAEATEERVVALASGHGVSQA